MTLVKANDMPGNKFKASCSYLKWQKKLGKLQKKNKLFLFFNFAPSFFYLLTRIGLQAWYFEYGMSFLNIKVYTKNPP